MFKPPEPAAITSAVKPAEQASFEEASGARQKWMAELHKVDTALCAFIGGEAAPLLPQLRFDSAPPLRTSGFPVHDLVFTDPYAALNATKAAGAGRKLFGNV